MPLHAHNGSETTRLKHSIKQHWSPSSVLFGMKYSNRLQYYLDSIRVVYHVCTLMSCMHTPVNLLYYHNMLHCITLHFMRARFAYVPGSTRMTIPKLTN